MSTHVLGHDRKGRRTPLITLFGIAAVAGAALAAVATAGNPTELPMSNLNTQAGKLTTLKTGVTYQASAFPIALRITPPDVTWGGGSGRRARTASPRSDGPASAIPPLDKPRGRYLRSRPRSARHPRPAAIARLRTGGSHLPEPAWRGHVRRRPSGVMLAGFSRTADRRRRLGEVRPPLCPVQPADARRRARPDSLQARARRGLPGHRSGRAGKDASSSSSRARKLPADQFPGLLTSANTLFRSLRFGGSFQTRHKERAGNQPVLSPR